MSQHDKRHIRKKAEFDWRNSEKTFIMLLNPKTVVIMFEYDY